MYCIWNGSARRVFTLLSFLQEKLAFQSEFRIFDHLLPVAEAVEESTDKQHGIFLWPPSSRPIERRSDVVDGDRPVIYVVPKIMQMVVEDSEVTMAGENSFGVDVVDVSACNKDGLALLRISKCFSCRYAGAFLSIVLLNGSFAELYDVVCHVQHHPFVLILELSLGYLQYF